MQYPATQSNQPELHLNQRYNQPIEQIKNQYQLNQPTISQTPQPLEQHQSARVFPSCTDPQANSQRRSQQKHQSQPLITSTLYTATKQSHGHHQPAQVFPSYTDQRTNNQEKYQQEQQLQAPAINKQHTFTSQSMPVYSQSSYQTPPSESITRTKIHPSRHVQQQTCYERYSEKQHPRSTIDSEPRSRYMKSNAHNKNVDNQHHDDHPPDNNLDFRTTSDSNQEKIQNQSARVSPSYTGSKQHFLELPSLKKVPPNQDPIYTEYNSRI